MIPIPILALKFGLNIRVLRSLDDWNGMIVASGTFGCGQSVLIPEQFPCLALLYWCQAQPGVNQAIGDSQLDVSYIYPADIEILLGLDKSTPQEFPQTNQLGRDV